MDSPYIIFIEILNRTVRFFKWKKIMSDGSEYLKSLLIVKSKPENLSRVESFLTNRGWIILNAFDIKNVLDVLMSKKPQMMMIPVDHPNSKIGALPKVLGNSFPVWVFYYLENPSSKNFNLLRQIKSEFTLSPPVTGPAIQRMAFKYSRKMKAENSAHGREMKVMSSEGDSQAHIVGQPQMGESQLKELLMIAEGEDGSLKNQGSFENSEVPSSSYSVGLIKGESAQDWGQSGSGKDINSNQDSLLKSSQFDSQSIDNYQNSMLSENPQCSLNKDISNESNKDLSTNLNRDSSGYSSMETNSGANGDSIINSSKESRLASDSNSSLDSSLSSHRTSDFDNQVGSRLNAGEMDPSHRSNKGSMAGNTFGKENNKNDESVRSKESNHSKNSHVAKDLHSKSGDRESKSSQLYQNKITVSDHSDEDTPPKTILEAGAKEALLGAAKVSQEKKESVEATSNVACIVISSSRFSGYLITAMGKDKVIDSQFLSKVQDRLFRFLKDNGEDLSERENMNIKLKQVEFEPWAMEQAQFLRKSIHNGNDVAMAFFPKENVVQQYGESVSDDMTSVKIDDIKDDIEVECSLYIYMPANNKYILYTPRGGKLYRDQKNRLKGKGVGELHLLKTEKTQFEKFKAQNYLNDKIDEFDLNKKNKLKKAN